MDNKQHYLPWIAIWGALFGVLNGIPPLYCCCFLWFPLGGTLAVMSISSKANVTIPFAEGAVIGLIAGAISGVLSGGIAGTVGALMGTAIVDWARTAPTVTPEQLAQIQQAYGNPGTSFFGSCCTFSVVGPAMGAIGGLLGSAIFKKGSSGGGVPQPQAF